MAERTLEERYDELVADYDKLKADYDGMKESFHPLQVHLDEALQKIQDINAGRQIELDTLKKTCEDQAEREREALAEQHAVAIAELKEKTLLPALKDLQARQAADLAAKHDAELQALVK